MSNEKTIVPEERTARVDNAYEEKTKVIGRSAQTDDYGEKTVKVGAQPQADGEKTVLVGRGRSASSGSGEADPVTGWLVVVQGPGRGNFVKLGLGLNTIGRGSNQRVSLNFGDEVISRENHAVVTYDPRGRKFYLQHGGGTNLTYIGDEPVLQPRELLSGEEISIGKTVLKFVAFCGSGFDWEMADAAKSP